MGMREEHRVGQPLAEVQEGSDYLTLDCKLPLNGIVDDSSELEAAACLVIEASDGSTHYWAIEHQTPKPDFHNRPGFLIALPGREN